MAIWAMLWHWQSATIKDKMVIGYSTNCIPICLFFGIIIFLIIKCMLQSTIYADNNCVVCISASSGEHRC